MLKLLTLLSGIPERQLETALHRGDLTDSYVRLCKELDVQMSFRQWVINLLNGEDEVKSFEDVQKTPFIPWNKDEDFIKFMSLGTTTFSEVRCKTLMKSIHNDFLKTGDISPANLRRYLWYGKVIVEKSRT